MQKPKSKMKLGLLIMIMACIGMQVYSYENLITRGLIARPKTGGSVFLGWRFLNIDNPTTVFDVYRSTSGGSYQKIATVSDSTNYEDIATSVDISYSYYVIPVDGGVEGPHSNTVTITAQEEGAKGYSLDIYGPLPNPHNPNKLELYHGMTGCPQNRWCRIATGDLNGDGLFDFVLSWGCRKEEANGQEFIVPPYPYDTQHIQAYLHDGTFLGWQFETGLSYGFKRKKFMCNMPIVVYDLDNDGNAEIITKMSKTPIDYQDSRDLKARATIRDYRLVVLDGMTGQKKAETPWPKAEDMPVSAIGIAYLNVSEGDNTPKIIIQEGTYNNGPYPNCLRAYRYTGSSLVEMWTINGCKTGHTIQILDFDRDGNDEFVIGSNVINEHGQLLWRYPAHHYHGDFTNVGNFDLGNDGFEAIFGIEHNAYKEDAIIIFTLPTPENPNVQMLETMGATDPHGNIANIHPSYSGLEIKTETGLYRCYCGIVNQLDDSFYTGKFLEWDGDDSQQEWLTNLESTPVNVKQYIGNSEIQTIDRLYGTGGLESIRTYILADIWGDFRDEVITRHLGTGDGSAGITVLTNIKVIHTKQPTPLLDRYYRHRMTQWAVYYQYNNNNISCGIEIPQPGGNLQISGTVTEDGSGIAGVVIDLSGAASRSTSTSPSGQYNMGGLGDGSYTLTPSLAGYVFLPDSLDVNLNGQNSTGNDFSAIWNLPIDKTITTATGKEYKFEKCRPVKKPYIDRDYTLVSIPQDYQNNYTMIRTAMDDKTAGDDPIITLTATDTAEIVVCWPYNITLVPWMSSWTNTGDIITMYWSETKPPAQYQLYKKTFPIGPIHLGPVSDDSMYFVLVKGKNGETDTPRVPTNLNANPDSPTSVDLTWIDESQIEEGFKIECSNDLGVNWIQIASVPANTEMYSDTDLTSGTTYWYRVRAYKGNNHSDYSNIAEASPTVPPTVNITSPIDNAEFDYGTDILITAHASDSDGTVINVEFYQDDVKLGEDTTPPFEYTWTGAAVGNYVLTAKAIDNNNAQTTSDPIHITVNPQGPITVELKVAMDNYLEWKDNDNSWTSNHSNWYTTVRCVGPKYRPEKDNDLRYKRSIFQFDLSSIPSNATIESATLKLYCYQANNSGNRNLRVYRINKQWIWKESCWNRPKNGAAVWDGCKPGLGSVNSASATITRNQELGWYTWDIKTLVQQWVNGTVNYGLLVKQDNDEVQATREFRFYSSMWSNSNFHPKLEITYTITAQ